MLLKDIALFKKIYFEDQYWIQNNEINANPQNMGLWIYFQYPKEKELEQMFIEMEDDSCPGFN